MRLMFLSFTLTIMPLASCSQQASPETACTASKASLEGTWDVSIYSSVVSAPRAATMVLNFTDEGDLTGSFDGGLMGAKKAFIYPDEVSLTFTTIKGGVQYRTRGFFNCKGPMHGRIYQDSKGTQIPWTAIRRDIQ